MPVARNPNLPQHHIGDMHYGELQLQHLPSGTENGQVLVWVNSTQQWKHGSVVGVSGLAVNVDPDTGALEISLSDRIVSDDYVADAIILAAIPFTLTADAVLV